MPRFGRDDGRFLLAAASASLASFSFASFASRASFPAAALPPGAAYLLLLTSEDGRKLRRRDLYARQTDYDSEWCFAVDPSEYKWKNADWAPPEFDQYIIYEAHVSAEWGD